MSESPRGQRAIGELHRREEASGIHANETLTSLTRSRSERCRDLIAAFDVWARTITPQRRIDVRYVFLIYLNEDDLPDEGTPELAEEWARYDSFTRETGARDMFETADALQPAGTATTLRLRQGDLLVTDGPFTETTEQLAGFYVLHCDDLDEALALAARIPAARHGSIEVRPIIEYGLARDPDFREEARASGRR